jgi:hypothetical protein
MSESELLAQFYKDWKQAEARAQMAAQTLSGAQNDAVLKEARFKGAAELLYGPQATWEYSEAKGLTFLTKREMLRSKRKLRARNE